MDARDKEISVANHWSAPEIIGDRAYFQFYRRPSSHHHNNNIKVGSATRLGHNYHHTMTGLSPRSPGVGLVLKDIIPSDDAEYHCRVDFKSSPTHNVRVKLHVIGKY